MKRTPSEIYNEWQLASGAIRRQFAERTGDPSSGMTAAIALYEELYAHTCGAVEPLNHAERFGYVRSNHFRFAAYRQLDGLFDELYKQLAAKRSRERFEQGK